MFAGFTDDQLLYIFLSLSLVMVSVILFYFRKVKLSMFFLFAGTFFYGLNIALLDPFLVIWDEQYHALVAKNMMNHPFRPVLYTDPVLDYDYRIWTANHIWLHKQPLFLWQMALSMKIFGVSEWALRLPSVLMHALLPLIVFRIGNISLNKRTGFISAVCVALALFPLELMAGKYTTDHNDMAFLFYVTASIWAWFEYMHSGKKYWIILIGLFSGGAVLVKWLVGLLVYAVWFVSMWFRKEQSSFWTKIKPYTFSLLITLFLFVPWQVYTHYAFPVESSWEMEYSSRHFFEAIEGHGGNAWYHWNALKEIYGKGDLIPFIYLTALIVMFFRIPRKDFRFPLIAALVVVYMFFSLAATKMISFCVIVSPIFFIALASLLDLLFLGLKKIFRLKMFVASLEILLILGLGYLLIDFSTLEKNHTFSRSGNNFSREVELVERYWIEYMKSELDNKPYVFLNANLSVEGHIPIMFYTDWTAYNYIPDTELIYDMIDKGYVPVVFDFGDLDEDLKKVQGLLVIQAQNTRSMQQNVLRSYPHLDLCLIKPAESFSDNF